MNKSVFLTKSVEWIIQWLTHTDIHLFCSWMNQCFFNNVVEWMIGDWFGDSYKDRLHLNMHTSLQFSRQHLYLKREEFLNLQYSQNSHKVPRWLIVSAEISMMWGHGSMGEDKYDECFTSRLHSYYYTTLSCSIRTMYTYILTVAKYLFKSSMYFLWVHQCFWTNRLSEWFNDFLKDIQLFLLMYESVLLNKLDEVNVLVICGHLVVYWCYCV